MHLLQLYMPKYEWAKMFKYVKLQKTYTLIKNIKSDTAGTTSINVTTHDGNFLKMLLHCSKTASRTLYLTKSTCL